MAENTISKEAIRDILAFRPALEEKKSLTLDNLDSPFFRFLTTLNITGFNMIFDYPAFLKESGYDCSSMDIPAGTDLETLRKIVTAQIRLDRFNGGYLEKLLNEGFFERFFIELEKFA